MIIGHGRDERGYHLEFRVIGMMMFSKEVGCIILESIRRYV